MGAGAGKDAKKNLIEIAQQGDGFRMRAEVLKMRGASKRIINSVVDIEGVSLLAHSVKSGDVATVLALLEGKADVSYPNGNCKNTALLWASSVQDDLGATAIVRSILDAKAQVNYANNFDQTALYLCAGRRTNVLTSYLIERGATVTKGSDTFGRSLLFEVFEKSMDGERMGLLIDRGATFNESETAKVLHVAARHQSHEILDMLIQRCGAEKRHLESPDDFGDSLLHIISKTGVPNEKAVKILIDAKADIELANYKGETPLLCALINDCSPDFVDFLLEARADPNHASPSNLTPLIAACRHSSLPFDIIGSLSKERASLNAQENVSRLGAIHVLAQRGDCNEPQVVSSAAFLVLSGARTDLVDCNLQIPLHIAYISAARCRFGVNGGAFLQELVRTAGQHDVHTRDYHGRIPRECYEDEWELLWDSISEEDKDKLRTRKKGEVAVPTDASQVSKVQQRERERQGRASGIAQGDQGGARMEEYLSTIRERVIPGAGGKSKKESIPPPPPKIRPPQPPPGGDDPDLLASLSRPKRVPGDSSKGGTPTGGTPPIKPTGGHKP